MSEFTEKLNSSELVSKAWDEIDRDQANAGLLIDTISNEFKDWQPPKPREIPVEIPQFVAVWFEDRMLGSFSAVIASYSFNDNEAIKWIYDNGGLDLLCKMKLYGYTVEKEQMFYLREKNTGYYLNKKLSHLELVVNPYFDENNKFTQAEIDKLQTGSYELVPVEDGE